MVPAQWPAHRDRRVARRQGCARTVAPVSMSPESWSTIVRGVPAARAGGRGRGQDHPCVGRCQNSRMLRKRPPLGVSSEAAATRPRVRLRIVFGDGISIGPGKADLLEGIRETGSISAAARRMRMSYKRAWLLVDELNGMFAAPLVAAARGGAQGGGAHLSGQGERVLALYRAAESRSDEAAQADLAALRELLRRP